MSDTTDPLMTLDACIRHLPEREKVSIYQLRRAIADGDPTAYKVAGVKGVCVKFNETRAALNRLEAQGRLRRGYGTMGEKAVVRDLSNVVGIEVIQ